MAVIPHRLKDAIKDNSLVLFIGAGFSKSLGLPDWKTLVKELIPIVATEKPALHNLVEIYEDGVMDTLEVLDKLFPYRGGIFDFLERRLDKDIDYSKINLNLHKKLWQISSQIITPNYDKAIEKAKDGTEWFSYDNLNKVRKLGNSDNYVLKIHGDIEDSAKCILFRSDYERLYNDKNAAIFELKATFAHKTILFIGFSMTDPYVQYIANYVNELFNGLNGKHYLVNVQENDFSKEGIETIKLNAWNELESFLNELIEIKSSSSKSHLKPESVRQAHISSLELPISVNSLNDYPKADNHLFTGREKEMVLFKDALTQHRLFAIEGLGGVGKTEFVTKCIDEFLTDKKRVIWLDGNDSSKFDVFVESAGYGDVLKGENKTQQAIFSGFKDLIERDERVIFWDNYQKITDATFSAFVNFAQQYLRKSNIIFIAKQEVYVNNSTIYTIPIKGLEGKSLEYAQKLRNSRIGFGGINDTDLKTLCDNTLGHPLAIKLSLPLLAKGLKVDELLSHIEKYKDLREVEELTKRIFKEVYDHPGTSLDEKELLQKFSIFNQKVTLPAIEYIYGKGNAFIILSALIDKFLISIEGDSYESHPLIRELSNNILVEKEPIHRLAAKYFMEQRGQDLNLALEEKIYYHLAQSNQWDLIEEEVEEKGRKYILLGQLGIVNDLIESLKKAGVNKPILNILYGDITQVRGQWADAKSYYENAANQDIDNRVKAEGTIKIGEILFRTGKTKEALSYFEEAHSFCRSTRLGKEEGRAVNDIGLVYGMYGDLIVAKQKFFEALEIREREGDKEGVAISLSNIGSILNDQGEYDEALVSLNKSLKIQNEIGNKGGLSNVLNHIANVLRAQGKTDDALDAYRQGLRIAEEIGNKQEIAASLGNIAATLGYQGDYRHAIADQQKSLEISLEIGDKLGVSNALINIGRSLKSEGKYPEAIGKFNESLNIQEEVGSKKGKAVSLAEIAMVLNEQQKYSEALKYLNQSFQIYSEAGALGELCILCHNIATIYSNDKIKNYEKALSYFFDSFAIKKQLRLDPRAALSWIKSIRDEKLGRDKFRVVAREVYGQMKEEQRGFIPIDELCKDGLKLKRPPSRTAPCPCGSGKQFKHCHGKDS